MTTLGVTGATGFIGRELIRSVRAIGWTVIPIMRADFNDDRLVAMFRGCDAVIHLAARAHVLIASEAQDETQFQFANVELTRAVARAASRAGVRRFIFVSSAGVFGRASPPAGFSDASTPLPHDAYTRSKLAAENMLSREFATEMEIVVVRPPLVYGPMAPGNFGRLVTLVRRGWPLPFGALRAPRSMVGLRNLCDLLRVATVHPEAAGVSMLVADVETRCVAELVRDIALAIGRSARVVTVPKFLLGIGLQLAGRREDLERLAAPFVVIANVAKHNLGWTPPYRLDEELAWSLSASDAREGPG